MRIPLQVWTASMMFEYDLQLTPLLNYPFEGIVWWFAPCAQDVAGWDLGEMEHDISWSKVSSPGWQYFEILSDSDWMSAGQETSYNLMGATQSFKASWLW